MTIDNLLNNIIKSQKVYTIDNEEVKLHSNISAKEGEFLKKVVNNLSPKKLIEIGCAYGVSSLYLCSALSESSNRASLIIIDPYQSTEWENIGITNLNRVNVDYFHLLEKPSEVVLPELLIKGEKFDFAFIDGWHTFDHVLIDFFYLNKMLNIGGVIVFDDVDYPSVNKLINYIVKYPAYEIVDHIEKTSKRILVKNFIYTVVSQLIKVIPKRISKNLFSINLINHQSYLRFNTTMIAIKKVKEDKRSWDWFENF